jgi:hypothetical protein
MTGLLHGYTVTDIHKIARVAAMANQTGADAAIRYERAWDEIIDALLDADEPPSRHDLASVAKGAITRRLVADRSHTYGVNCRDTSAGTGSAPRFAAYWFRIPGTPIDEAVTDRIALRQVWDALRERDAVATGTPTPATTAGTKTSTTLTTTTTMLATSPMKPITPMSGCAPSTTSTATRPTAATSATAGHRWPTGSASASVRLAGA